MVSAWLATKPCMRPVAMTSSSGAASAAHDSRASSRSSSTFASRSTARGEGRGRARLRHAVLRRQARPVGRAILGGAAGRDAVEPAQRGRSERARRLERQVLGLLRCPGQRPSMRMVIAEYSQHEKVPQAGARASGRASLCTSLVLSLVRDGACRAAARMMRCRLGPGGTPCGWSRLGEFRHPGRSAPPATGDLCCSLPTVLSANTSTPSP